jgi:molybdopterin/thiamine biosynthesis adenylyltransferase
MNSIARKPFDYSQAFSRNIGITTEAEQQQLRNATVCIAGMGGVGGDYLITLVRAGIGHFKIADFDNFELVNLNRQYGAAVSTIGQPKVTVMERLARDINPELTIERFDAVSEDNLDDYLLDCSLVVDGIEFFEVATHRMLIDGAVERGIPALAAVPLGFGAALLAFTDGGMGFDDYFAIEPDMSGEEKVLQFALGFAPAAYHLKYLDTSRINIRERRGPSSSAACKLCAGMIAAQVVVAILHPDELRPAPWYTNFDARLNRFKQRRLWLGNRNPMQRLKRHIAKRRLGIKSSTSRERWANDVLG